MSGWLVGQICYWFIIRCEQCISCEMPLLRCCLMVCVHRSIHLDVTMKVRWVVKLMTKMNVWVLRKLIYQWKWSSCQQVTAILRHLLTMAMFSSGEHFGSVNGLHLLLASISSTHLSRSLCFWVVMYYFLYQVWFNDDQGKWRVSSTLCKECCHMFSGWSVVVA